MYGRIIIRRRKAFYPSPFCYSAIAYGAGAAIVKMVLRIFSKVSQSSPLPTHLLTVMSTTFKNCAPENFDASL